MAASAVTVRPRTDSDLDACVGLAEVVHANDGYPVYLDDGGLRRFVESIDAVATWVTERDGAVVGHVVLNRRSTRPAVRLAAERLAVGPDQLGFVARLLVAPPARRSGIGTTLLGIAAKHARSLGLVPVLDVVADTPAVAVYDRAGWTRLGRAAATFADGTVTDELVFAAPA